MPLDRTATSENVRATCDLLGTFEGADFKDPSIFAKGAAIAAERIDPHIVWDLSDIGNPDGENFTGFEGVSQLWGSWLAMWDAYTFETGGIWEAGDQVLVEIHIRAVGRGSGAPVGMLQPQRWTFRDGRIAHIKVHATTPAALEAMGLSADAEPVLRGPLVDRD